MALRKRRRTRRGGKAKRQRPRISKRRTSRGRRTPRRRTSKRRRAPRRITSLPRLQRTYRKQKGGDFAGRVRRKVVQQALKGSRALRTPPTEWKNFVVDDTPIGHGSFGEVWAANIPLRAGWSKATCEGTGRTCYVSRGFKPTFDHPGFLRDEHDVEGVNVEGIGPVFSIAVKVMADKRSDMDIPELQALQAMRDKPSQHILKMYSHFFTNPRMGSPTLYIITELLQPAQELYEVVESGGRMGEEQAKEHMRQIFAGVAHIHALGWAHRDLKLENVIMYTPPTDGFVDKIIDFGFAARQTDPGRNCTGVMGTAAYVAPEVISDQTYDGWAVDMYACGVMLYVMLCGEYPFPSRGLEGVGPDMRESSKEAIRHSAVSLEGKGLSAAAKHLISSLMHNEPTTRPTAAEVLDGDAWLVAGAGAGAAAVYDPWAPLQGLR